MAPPNRQDSSYIQRQFYHCKTTLGFHSHSSQISSIQCHKLLPPEQARSGKSFCHCSQPPADARKAILFLSKFILMILWTNLDKANFYISGIHLLMSTVATPQNSAPCPFPTHHLRGWYHLILCYQDGPRCWAQKCYLPTHVWNYAFPRYDVFVTYIHSYFKQILVYKMNKSGP